MIDFLPPSFGFGSAPLGELYKAVSEQVATDVLQSAWDRGVRYYDTAPWYGRGLSEQRVGRFLSQQPRNEFYVTTKVGRYLIDPKQDGATFKTDPWFGGLKQEVVFDYSYDGIMRSYEQSKKRLGLDQIDALFIHDLDRGYHGVHWKHHQNDLTKTGFKALEALKKAGDIKAYGMGINSHEAFEDAMRLFDLDLLLVAMPYTLLDQSSLMTTMQACVDTGTHVIIGSPFCSGILATGVKAHAKYNYAEADKAMIEKVDHIERICKRYDVSLSAAALQFPMAHPAVVSIIPGACRAKEIIQNTAAFKQAIPASFWDALKAETLIDINAPVFID